MKDQILKHSGLVFIIRAGLNPPHRPEPFRFITSQPQYGRSPGITFSPLPPFSISSMGLVIKSQGFSHQIYIYRNFLFTSLTVESLAEGFALPFPTALFWTQLNLLDRADLVICSAAMLDRSLIIAHFFILCPTHVTQTLI